MITKIALKFGPAAASEPLALHLRPSITIFVGPNNSGKSEVLRELAVCIQQGRSHANTKILAGLSFGGLSDEQAKAELDALTLEPATGENIPFEHVKIRIGSSHGVVNKVTFLNALTRPEQHPAQFGGWFAWPKTLNLGGVDRLQLVNPQDRGNLKSPQSVFARLFVNDEVRSRLRETIFRSLKFHLAIDASEGSALNLRFGDTAPPNERSLEDDTLDYMRDALSANEISDGAKAFVGVLTQLYAGDPKILIIDEPEAFLHPSLAHTLGKELARGAANEGKLIFASTHSPQFVMGAILSGANVNIIRLTYAEGVGTARSLSSADLTALMQDPLLRSAGLISGLFYDSVVVGESDADRAFYHEVNERLLAAADNRAIPHCLFLNAQNKQTIPRMIVPLRKLGIPAAAVTDIDVVKDGGSTWKNALEACSIPTIEHAPYQTRRANLLASLAAVDADYKRKGGIGLLTDEKLEAANNFCEDLQKYGLFIVPRGEVEAWLRDLDVDRGKQTWLRTIFEKMGSDPTSQVYVRPAAGDVWDFLGEIHKWVANPNRHGIPK